MLPRSKTDFSPRWALPADIPGLFRLWETAFGDSPEEVAPFFEQIFRPSTTAVIGGPGAPLAMMHLLPCRMPGMRGYYVYAVATLPDYRGRGFMRLLDTFCRDAAQRRDRGFLILVPAAPELFEAYGKLGYRTYSAISRRELNFSETAENRPSSHLSFGEFSNLRSRYLRRFARPVRFEETTEEFAYRDYLQSGIIRGDGRDYFCVRIKGDSALVTETSLSPEVLPEYLAACPELKGIRRITLLTPGDEPFSMLKMTDGSPLPQELSQQYFNFPLD